MSLLRPQRGGESLLTGYVESRSNRIPGERVTPDTALRHSAVWACVRLRADLITSLPVDAYRRVGKINVEVPKPPILLAPGGEHWEYDEWMWASQADLDKVGNTIGLITKKNGAGLPAEIELVPTSAVTIRVPRNKTMHEREYKIDHKIYRPEQVWHERQFPVAGLPVGLSPVAYAAWSIGEYANIQQFALDWFAGGGIPRARLKNTKKTVDAPDAGRIKERFKAAISNGDIFVHGNDWEYDLIQAQQMDFGWLEAKQYGLTDVCRFFGCPADLIDAAVSGSSITYASITQRNLQFLIHHLGPAITRRERKLSKWAGEGRYIKMNTEALLRMDPAAVAETLERRIKSRTITPDEAREKYDQPPLTPEQVDQFSKLFGDPGKKAPATVDPKAQADEGRSIEHWEHIDAIARKDEIE